MIFRKVYKKLLTQINNGVGYTEKKDTLGYLFFQFLRKGEGHMKLPKMTWRYKLITTSLLCLVLPTVFMIALTGIQAKQEFQKKALLKAEQSLEVADLYISGLFNDMIMAMNGVQYSSETITLLRTALTKYIQDDSKNVRNSKVRFREWCFLLTRYGRNSFSHYSINHYLRSWTKASH